MAVERVYLALDGEPLGPSTCFFPASTFYLVIVSYQFVPSSIFRPEVKKSARCCRLENLSLLLRIPPFIGPTMYPIGQLYIL